MRKQVWMVAAAAGALMLGGCGEATGENRTVSKVTEAANEKNISTRDGETIMSPPKIAESDSIQYSRALPSELRDRYRSIRFPNINQFDLEDGRLCDKTISRQAGARSKWREPRECYQERIRRTIWNKAIEEELSRYDFLENFQGDENLTIPGNSQVSGNYQIYNGYNNSDGSTVLQYIGQPRPFTYENGDIEKNTYLVPLASISETPNSFIVPMWNYEKRRAYEKKADSAVQWISVSCDIDRRFTNTVVYFSGDLRSPNFEYIQSYANNDNILDYHISFMELKILMTDPESNFPFMHLPSSPFYSICDMQLGKKHQNK